MCNNNYVSQGASWLKVINFYKESDILSDPPELGEIGTKVYQFPFSSFSPVKRGALLGALEDGDGPGNGGGSPSALKFYFSIPQEAVSLEQLQ